MLLLFRTKEVTSFIQSTCLLKFLSFLENSSDIQSKESYIGQNFEKKIVDGKDGQ